MGDQPQAQIPTLDLKSLAQEALQVHNSIRKIHNAPDLELDHVLTTTAQSWADQLLRQNKVENSPAAKRYGENIFHAHSKSNVPIARCIKSWCKEGKLFDWNEIKHYKGTGHFTQVIWKGSKKLGVGYSTSGTNGTFLVCNYDPPGNITDSYPENLSPPSAPLYPS